jgi:hypothetical protein
MKQNTRLDLIYIERKRVTRITDADEVLTHDVHFDAECRMNIIASRVIATVHKHVFYIDFMRIFRCREIDCDILGTF